MSRITALTLTPARLRFRTPVQYGTSTITSLDIGILRLATDDGLVGLGEVTGPLPRADGGAPIAPEVVAMIGRDPADIVATEAGIYGGALATAALDVLGQRQGRSLVELLGGGSDSVAVNGLLVIGQATPDADARDAAEIVSSGFQTIKVKPAIGAAQGIVTDSLWAVRERLGASVAIRLDLNGACAERAVVDWLVSLETLRLEYVEQPIGPALGVRAMARVRAVIPMHVAVDESVTDEDAASRLMDEGACDVLVIKPARVGGPMTSVRIARAAAAAGVGVTVSTLYDSGVGLACALHVAATIPGDGAHGLSTAALFVSDLVGAGLPISGGRMSLPGRPGLGVTLDASAMSVAAADALDAHAEAGADVAVLG